MRCSSRGNPSWQIEAQLCCSSYRALFCELYLSLTHSLTLCVDSSINISNEPNRFWDHSKAYIYINTYMYMHTYMHINNIRMLAFVCMYVCHLAVVVAQASCSAGIYSINFCYTVVAHRTVLSWFQFHLQFQFQFQSLGYYRLPVGSPKSFRFQIACSPFFRPALPLSHSLSFPGKTFKSP